MLYLTEDARIVDKGYGWERRYSVQLGHYEASFTTGSPVQRWAHQWGPYKREIMIEAIESYIERGWVTPDKLEDFKQWAGPS